MPAMLSFLATLNGSAAGILPVALIAAADIGSRPGVSRPRLA